MSKKAPFKVLELHQHEHRSFGVGIRRNGTISLAKRQHRPNEPWWVDEECITQTDLNKIEAVLTKHRVFIAETKQLSERMEKDKVRLKELENELSVLRVRMVSDNESSVKATAKMDSWGWCSTGGYSVKFTTFGLGVGCKFFGWGQAEKMFKLLRGVSRRVMGR